MGSLAPIYPARSNASSVESSPNPAATLESIPGFADIRGQTTAKRPGEFAAAGFHNVLLVGPLGSGKTVLASRLAGILPPLEFADAFEATQIQSVAGRFRPGDASLAHNGVQFLHELPEFARNVLEQLRQPLEEGSLSIARASGTLRFPARSMLIVAMNPCPFGYYGDPSRESRCTGAVIQRYLGKISVPLLDRFDLHVEVPALPCKEMRAPNPGLTSEQMRERVADARARQSAGGHTNAALPPSARPVRSTKPVSEPSNSPCTKWASPRAPTTVSSKSRAPSRTSITRLLSWPNTPRKPFRIGAWIGRIGDRCPDLRSQPLRAPPCHARRTANIVDDHGGALRIPGDAGHRFVDPVQKTTP